VRLDEHGVVTEVGKEIRANCAPRHVGILPTAPNASGWLRVSSGGARGSILLRAPPTRAR
jgi:hypothetical protein